MSEENKPVYRALRNYLNNTCGANPGEIKKYIETYAQQRADAFIQDYIKKVNNYTEEAIQKAVAQRTYYWQGQFERFSQLQIEKVIENTVKKVLQDTLDLKGVSVEIKLPAKAKRGE